jgi:hypothetical protein
MTRSLCIRLVDIVVTRFLWAAVFLLSASAARGQVNVNSQLWLDYNVVYPFANVWTADAEFSYQTLLTGGEKWRSYQFTPSMQRNMSQRIDLMVSIPLYYTVQLPDYHTIETRISPAMRFIITANRRVESRSVLRYDFRAVKQLEEGDWQISNRSRLSLEAIIALNQPTIYQDKCFMLIVDGELFFVLDKNIDERYANLRKARMGLGYRLSYKHRFEAIYQVHRSRTTIDQDFDTRDNVFRLRYTMVFNPPRVAPVSGTN